MARNSATLISFIQADGRACTLNLALAFKLSDTFHLCWTPSFKVKIIHGKEKSKNSSATGIIVMFALAFSAVTAIPKNAWIAMGVIAGVGTILWLLVRREKRQHKRVPESSKITSLQETQYSSRTSSKRRVSMSQVDAEETSDFYTVQLGSSPSAYFKIPDASSEESDARWVSAGETVTVSRFLLPCGMFYVGSALGADTTRKSRR